MNASDQQALTAASTQTEADSKIRLRLWLQFLKLSRGVETQLRENLRQQFNSTLPRFDVMAALSRFPGGLKMSEISSELRVSNGNMTGIIDRLEAEKSVVRVAVPGDRRAILIKLTSKGRKEFNEQASAHEQWVDELLSVFSAQQAVALSDQLDLFTHPEKTDGAVVSSSSSARDSVKTNSEKAE